MEGEPDWGAFSILLLAGGAGARVGGRDKGLLPLGGRPIVAHVLDRVPAGLTRRIASANRNAAAYCALGLEVVADAERGHPGPLAGIEAGLEDCRTRWLLTLPCDTPFLPRDIVARLAQSAMRASADAVVTHDGERMQHLVTALRADLLPALRAFRDRGGQRVQDWLATLLRARLDCGPPQAFANLNTTDDFAAAERRIAEDAA